MIERRAFILLIGASGGPISYGADLANRFSRRLAPLIVGLIHVNPEFLDSRRIGAESACCPFRVRLEPSRDWVR
jgi:hypothetical protein